MRVYLGIILLNIACSFTTLMKGSDTFYILYKQLTWTLSFYDYMLNENKGMIYDFNIILNITYSAILSSKLQS